MKDFIIESLDRLPSEDLRIIAVVVSELLKGNEGHRKEAK